MISVLTQMSAGKTPRVGGVNMSTCASSILTRFSVFEAVKMKEDCSDEGSRFY